MIIIDAYMMLKLYREESGADYVTKWYPQPGTQEFENCLEEFMEDFLEEIFGHESILTRGNFINSVNTKSAWIFESEDIRKKWNDICFKNPACIQRREQLFARGELQE